LKNKKLGGGTSPSELAAKARSIDIERDMMFLTAMRSLESTGG
jgi:hypothetical protein